MNFALLLLGGGLLTKNLPVLCSPVRIFLTVLNSENQDLGEEVAGLRFVDTYFYSLAVMRK